MKKRIIGIMLIIVLVVSLAVTVAACNNSNKTKIGVMLYNFTDIQGTEIKSYCEYLEKNFDVEFVYEAVGSNDEAHISGLQNLLSQGCNAVISGYDTALSRSIAMCEDAGAYYAVLLGEVSKYEYLEENGYQPTLVEGMDIKYFLGGVTQFGGDPETVGVAYAEAAYAAGLKKIGAISFPTFTFKDGETIYNSFKTKLAELDPTANVYELQTFMYTQELCEAEVTKLLTNHPDVEAVLGLGSGLDYIYPALQNAGSNAKLLALGYNNTVESLLSQGKLLTAGTNNYTQCVASVFVRIWDALNGKSFADQGEDDINGIAGYPIITSSADLADFKSYIIPSDKANGSITAEELKNAMVTYNENATWAALNELTGRTLAEIKEARAA